MRPKTAVGIISFIEKYNFFIKNMPQAIADIKICCIFALAKRERPLLKGVSVKQKNRILVR